MKKIILILVFITGGLMACFASDGSITPEEQYLLKLSPFVAIVTALTKGFNEAFNITVAFWRGFVSFIFSALLTTVCYFLNIGLYSELVGIVQLIVVTIVVCLISNGVYSFVKESLKMFIIK